MAARKDKKGRVLKEGERQRKNGTYEYRWTERNGQRHSIYANNLSELRDRKEQLVVDRYNGLRVGSNQITLNQLYLLWKKLKKGIKENTFQNYQYMYEHYVFYKLGHRKIRTVKRSDVRLFYCYLVEQQNLNVSTIDCIHTVLHQVLQIAVEDDFIKTNPSDNALTELKKVYNVDRKRRKALLIEEQKLLEDFLSKEGTYRHWKPIFTVMLYTGLRVGEITGLRWEDIDLEKGVIYVNHTLVFFSLRGKSTYAINTPKTSKSKRVVPMMSTVKNAFHEVKEYYEKEEIVCNSIIDGYTDFIFLNRFGCVMNYTTLNKALNRIVRDCNLEQLEKNEDDSNVLLLPRISCHSFRHTFTTRMIESSMKIKAVQEILGHADIGTTMNIYAEVTDELKVQEIGVLEKYMKEQELTPLNSTYP